jgi:hypothetical protein
MDKSRVWRAASILALLVTFGADLAGAQDSNYWSIAYGTRSQLLGGVVVGSPGDISATYYNPGALALTQSTELLLAGNAYQYASVSVDNGSGPGRKLASSSIAAVPSLFAGEIPILEKSRLAYAFLTRRSMDMKIESRSTTGVDGIVPIASPVFSAAEVQLKQNFDEGWYGMTWAKPLSSTLGFGISPFLVVRSQRTRAALLTEGRDASDQAAILSQSREYDYMHWSLLARIGLSGVRDSLTYGITLTTPNLGVTGSGNTSYNTTLIDQTGTIGNIVGADYQQKLKATYRTPLGAAFGASYGFGATRLHTTVDWFAEVPRYTVLETPEFTVRTPSGDSTVKVVISDELRDVLNWGVGFEHRFSETVVGFASYHTDLSARVEGSPPSASVTRWNLSHFAAGATWHVWRSDLALGISTAFGSQKTPPLPPSPDGGFTPNDLETHETLITVILGWKISF